METLAIVLIVLVFAVLVKSVVIVRQGYEYTVENFGRFTRSLPRTSHIPAPNTHRPLLNSCFPAFQ